MWDLIVSVPDRCLSFYFESLSSHRHPDSKIPYLIESTRALLERSFS